MDQNLDIKMDEFGKAMAKDIQRSRENNNIRHSRSPANFNPKRPYLFFGAIGVLVLIVLLVLLSGRDNEVKVAEFNSVKAKLDGLEKRLTRLEGTDRKIARLESQVRKLEQSMSKWRRSASAKAKKSRYHEVRRGDTLSRVAQRYGITVKELCRLNKITPKTIIRPGQKLLIPSPNR